MKAHDRQPVDETGRRNTPIELLGVTRAGAVLPTIAGREVRSVIAIYVAPLLPLGEVADEFVNLILGKSEVRHASVLAACLFELGGVGIHRLLGRSVA